MVYLLELIFRNGAPSPIVRTFRVDVDDHENGSVGAIFVVDQILQAFISPTLRPFTSI